MVTTNRPNTKNGVLTVTNLFFGKFCFNLRTSYKELIWCVNDPNANICTFCNRWSFIWRGFFPVSILKELKVHFEIVKSNLQENSSISDHLKWVFLKYKIRKISISLSNNLARTERIMQANLDSRIKTLKQNLKNEEDFIAYNGVVKKWDQGPQNPWTWDPRPTSKLKGETCDPPKV